MHSWANHTDCLDHKPTGKKAADICCRLEVAKGGGRHKYCTPGCAIRWGLYGAARLCIIAGQSPACHSVPAFIASHHCGNSGGSVAASIIIGLLYVLYCYTVPGTNLWTTVIFSWLINRTWLRCILVFSITNPSVVCRLSVPLPSTRQYPSYYYYYLLLKNRTQST